MEFSTIRIPNSDYVGLLLLRPIASVCVCVLVYVYVCVRVPTVWNLTFHVPIIYMYMYLCSVHFFPKALAA